MAHGNHFSSRQQGVLKVTTTRMIVGFFACPMLALFIGFSSADAQTRVSVLDLGEVLKNHPTFPQQLEGLKSEAERFKQGSLQLRQQMMKKAEVLRQYKPGSDEFKQAESDLAKESAALEVEQRNQMRSLMEREATLHFEAYQQVQAAISSYCEPREIQLVLRHNDVEMKKGDPSSVMRKVNGSIVFHQPSHDITAAVIAELSKVVR